MTTIRALMKRRARKCKRKRKSKMRTRIVTKSGRLRRRASKQQAGMAIDKG
jgi:hypothetical protein